MRFFQRNPSATNGQHGQPPAAANQPQAANQRRGCNCGSKSRNTVQPAQQNVRKTRG